MRGKYYQLDILKDLVHYYNRRPFPIREREQHTAQTAIGIVFRLSPMAQTLLRHDQPFQDLLQTKHYQLNQHRPQPKLRYSLLRLLERVLVQHGHNDQDLFDVLFQLRSNKGSHAGQICCPGGHLEPHEDDYQAVLREVNEETGLDLNSHIYLGKMDHNFNPYTKPNGQPMLIQPHLFLVVDHNDMILTPQPDEVQYAFWSPFSRLVLPGHATQKSKEAQKGGLTDRLRRLHPLISQTHLCTQVPGIMLTDQDFLWGITLHIMLALLRQALALEQAQPTPDHLMTTRLQAQIRSCEQYGLQFRYDLFSKL